MTIGHEPAHLDDPLGAFCRHTHMALPGAASGWLQGLTFGVKDVFHIAEHPTGFGHPDWLRTHPPAAVTATTVQRLLAAGAHMVGKTHTDELAYSLTGENVHYGTPVNSRDPQRIPGSSSNGSASAVAGGRVDFALGTDCGGSVRVPASYCGLWGTKLATASFTSMGNEADRIRWYKAGEVPHKFSSGVTASLQCATYVPPPHDRWRGNGGISRGVCATAAGLCGPDPMAL